MHYLFRLWAFHVAWSGLFLLDLSAGFVSNSSATLLATWKLLEVQHPGAPLKKTLSLYRRLLAELDRDKDSNSGIDINANTRGRYQKSVKHGKSETAIYTVMLDSIIPITIPVNIDIVLVGPPAWRMMYKRLILQSPEELSVWFANIVTKNTILDASDLEEALGYHYWFSALFARKTGDSVTYSYTFRFIDTGDKTAQVAERFLQRHLIRPPHTKKSNSSGIKAHLHCQHPYIPIWRMEGLLGDLAIRLQDEQYDKSIERGVRSNRAAMTLFIIKPRRSFVSNFNNEVYGYSDGFSEVDFESMRLLICEKICGEEKDCPACTSGDSSKILEQMFTLLGLEDNEKNSNIDHTINYSEKNRKPRCSNKKCIFDSQETSLTQLMRRNSENPRPGQGLEMNRVSSNKVERALEVRDTQEKEELETTPKNDSTEPYFYSDGGSKRIQWFDASDIGSMWSSDIFGAMDEDERLLMLEQNING